jgi:DNA-binding NarL/FixJ family response regulator
MNSRGPASGTGVVSGAVRVSLLANDPLWEAGLTAVLGGAPTLSLRRFDVDERSDVTVVFLPREPAETMRALQRSFESHGSRAAAVVCGTAQLDARALARSGVVTVTHACEADLDGLMSAVRRASRVPGRPWTASSRDVDEQLRRVREHDLHRARPQLTVREIAVLRHLADGLQATEIGQLMQMSPRSLKYVLWCIMRRFSLNNRVEAVAFAIRSGVI